MCAWVLVFCCLASGAGPSAPAPNEVLTELLETGISAPGGPAVKLPPPSLPDGLDAKRQTDALAKLPGARHSVDQLLRKSVVAPFELKIHPPADAQGESSLWRVDAWFVAYGSLEEVAQEDFLKRWSRLGGGKETSDVGSSEGLSRAGKLSDAEIADRKLFKAGEKQPDEYFLYSTFSLFDRVQLSATRHAAITRSDESLLIAAKIDPRFDADEQHPNQWRPMKRDELGKIEAGKPHPYEDAGFYAKVTRLKQPAGALFVEYHQAFQEPRAWFGGANLLRSKLPILAQDAVRDFRRKLKAKAE
ncbi:MAG TPA: hypothetical protein VN699_07920 [Pirellulales bacterium]|nr:hypothetical protein [Pirellulales bacterium]